MTNSFSQWSKDVEAAIVEWCDTLKAKGKSNSHSEIVMLGDQANSQKEIAEKLIRGWKMTYPKKVSMIDEVVNTFLVEYLP